MAALLDQLKGASKSKRATLYFRLREAMYGVPYLELPDGRAVQWVAKEDLQCGTCHTALHYRNEVEVIAA